MEKANLCFISSLYFNNILLDYLEEAETTYFKVKFVNIFQGKIYLNKNEWGNAKILHLKAAEIKRNSPLAWLGLGIASLRFEDYVSAEQALIQSNIYDPFNSITWGYLVLLCLKIDDFERANQALRQLFKCEPAGEDYVKLMEELCEEFTNREHFQTALKLYEAILNSESNKQEKVEEIHMKMAFLFTKLKDIEKAREIYMNMLDVLDDEVQKENIRNHLITLRNL